MQICAIMHKKKIKIRIAKVLIHFYSIVNENFYQMIYIFFFQGVQARTMIR